LASSQEIKVKRVSDKKYLLLSFCSLTSRHVTSGLKGKSGVPSSCWWDGGKSSATLEREDKGRGFCALGG